MSEQATQFNLAKVFIGFLMLVVPLGCMDFGVDDQIYVCRAQRTESGAIGHDCGPEAACLRGPGGYCICKPLNSPAEPGYDDPNCQRLPAGETCTVNSECESQSCNGVCN